MLCKEKDSVLLDLLGLNHSNYERFVTFTYFTENISWYLFEKKKENQPCVFFCVLAAHRFGYGVGRPSLSVVPLLFGNYWAIKVKYHLCRIENKSLFKI